MSSEPCKDRRRTREERRAVAEMSGRGDVEDGFHHDEESDAVDERAHPTLLFRGLEPDPVWRDILVVDNDGFPHIAIPQSDHRWSPEMHAGLFVPEVHAPERPFPNLVFDSVEYVVRICRTMQSAVDAECDGF